MIPELLEQARKIASVGPTKYQTPPQQVADFTTKKAVELANKLHADVSIVEVGCLLMDCELGITTKEGRVAQHIEEALQTTKKLLSDYPNISSTAKENILACIAEHHGAKKFSTLEAEICCNADCYKFASVDGFVLALRFMRPMPIGTQLNILRDKLDEKWDALTLAECKDELKPQYEIIKQLLGTTNLH